MERWHAQLATVSRVAKMSVSRWHVVSIFSALHTGHFCSSCLTSTLDLVLSCYGGSPSKNPNCTSTIVLQVRVAQKEVTQTMAA